MVINKGSYSYGDASENRRTDGEVGEGPDRIVWKKRNQTAWFGFQVEEQLGEQLVKGLQGMGNPWKEELAKTVVHLLQQVGSEVIEEIIQGWENPSDRSSALHGHIQDLNTWSRVPISQ